MGIFGYMFDIFFISLVQGFHLWWELCINWTGQKSHNLRVVGFLLYGLNNNCDPI